MRQISSHVSQRLPRLFRELLPRAAAGLPIALSACAVQNSPPPLGPHALAERLSPILQASQEQGMRWGIVIATQDGKVLFSRNPNGRFIPASNTKLFTTAAAMAELAKLDQEAAEHPTTLLLAPRPHGAPDLILRGSGDAVLSDNAACQTDCLKTLADALSAKRLRRIHAIIADDQLFADERWGDGWSWNNLPTQWGTAVSALTLNDNVAGLAVQPGTHPGDRPLPKWSAPDEGLTLVNQALTVPDGKPELSLEKKPGDTRVVLTGTLPAGVPVQTLKIGLDDPALSAARHFRSLLREAGIRVQDIQVRHRLTKTAADTPAPDTRILATLPAPDLKDDIRHLLKVSQNLHAELLLRRLALIHGNGSAEDGLTERRQVLTALGLPAAGFSLYDGSGMSPYNRVTPQTVIQLLRLADRQPWGADWRDDLPLAGRDGTLAHRFIGTPVAGHLHAKTGTLAATHSLSGYLQTTRDQILLITIFANDIPDDLPHPTKIMDDLVTAVAEAE
ncbi:MAG: D-alanyl-D-alanine carboxypeptidase/D-alanyl-D-alanine-endopeptidase [Gluconobacter potus]|uniref:D-alanyl-D-alanine carboxypeptidase/D-alanyl-D-alanine-endopeptidase n=1 Tax=Gluconobacter potus TaxID=2724927 RepID=A0ABR9YIH2_9PROT|nr:MULTISPECIES: D-alanyl-D-alanine carboxypeptidase/D-alanyl-D-alanine-endopeptidase [Gluconobacter]MBF0863445.1 D-alanyl-D-alanine carboxypeptidase/D-alanyl-D-alanine-endopeptidase [Gluconobacter sp. R71656]MBF0866252.1 D-alanyl-D-alanine carboxypeptidase/D-alanyl-D-alanine-endopeptidase [Gluconobacter sp. R75628]MBF0872620.1 D-alanyl-D-alanine carboxypeptidase/D-alanyl-D-alanine-endopeptidase [Gluconobacter sp. R75629]MBF0881586.1 D-alanyl-D-alanine carboxypeptidase/D-alanyl-D-alanine-endope